MRTPAVTSTLVCLLGCGRLAGLDDEAEVIETETGEELKPGEILWTYDLDVDPRVLEATPHGVIVGGARPIWIDADNLDFEAEVFALDHEGSRVWTWTGDTEEPLPGSIHALAWDENGVWVGFDTHHFCVDSCPETKLARLDPVGAELWRIELSNAATSWAIRTIGSDAVVVGSSGEYAPPASQIHRVDASGNVVWEQTIEPPGELNTTGIELFDGALWVVGRTGVYDDYEPWVARLDPDTGQLLEIVDTQLPSGPAWSAVAMPTGLAVVMDDRVWALDGDGDTVWMRGIPVANGLVYLYRCRFDARADGLWAVTGEGGMVELLDGGDLPRWSWEAEDHFWQALALGQQLYLAEGFGWGTYGEDVPELAGRLHAVQTD